MNHNDHVGLLKGGIPNQGGVWADLGSGTGAFTLALADLIGANGQIYSVDRDAKALQQQALAFRQQFPHAPVQYREANFTQPLELPPLDGIVMANALHFVERKQQAAVVMTLKNYLKPTGRLIVVEYDADQGNTWVPYPLRYATWEKLATQSGFTHTRLLKTVPSRFLQAIYSAVSELA